MEGVGSVEGTMPSWTHQEMPTATNVATPATASASPESTQELADVELELDALVLFARYMVALRGSG